MALTALPTELLQLIAEQAMPNDFESFMLCCRTVFESARPLLARHNHYRRHFSSLVLDEEHRSTVPTLLHFARDPVAAEYVKDVDFWNSVGLPSTMAPLDQDTLNGIDLFKELKPLTCGSACMRVPNVSRDTWLDELVDEIRKMHTLTTASITILATLPNVRRMTPSFHWKYFDHLDEVADSAPGEFWQRLLRAMVTGSQDEPTGKKPLESLSLVRPCDHTGYDSYTSLQMFGPFMLVPSVKTMCLTSCKAVADGYTGDPFKWVQMSQHTSFSSIERLELSHCCIAGPEIGEVVRHMPRLRTLRYAHQTKWHGCLHDWDAGDFIAHLGKWCGEYLVELSVTMPLLFGDSDGAAPFLKQFISLKHLELELPCLGVHGMSIDGAEPPPMPAIQSAVKLAFTEVPSPYPIYNLADILPRSIKSLRMIGSEESSKDHIFVRSLFAGVQPRQEQDLPFLERVDICRPQEQNDVEPGVSGGDMWFRLADLLPSAIKYSYSETTPAQAAWLGEFSARFPYVEEL